MRTSTPPTLAALALAACALTACSNGPSTNAPEGGKPDGTKTTENNPTPAKKHIVVGFSQIGAESAWRTANTDSIKAEAEKRGIELKFSDAQQKQENQIKAIRSFIAQGVDVIAFSPVVETGWTDVLKEAKDAGIPVIVSDRRPDVKDDLYVTFIGSDFIEEGQRAAQWLADHTNGKAQIAELTGTPGSAPANDRAKGFRDVIAKYPGMKIIYSQTGDFKRANGKEVMEAFLKNPKSKTMTAVFAHNDDMVIGAIQAMEEAGLKPGAGVTIVSVDGIHDALQAIKDGKMNATVECNPLLGPFLFDAIEALMRGETLPKRTVIKDLQFDASNASTALPDRKY